MFVYQMVYLHGIVCKMSCYQPRPTYFFKYTFEWVFERHLKERNDARSVHVQILVLSDSVAK